MSEVILHTKFNASNLNYIKPVNQQNIYYSAIDYDGKPCYIQSTKLLVEDIINENNQRHLLLKVDPKGFEFYDLLVKLDDHNLSKTYQSSTTWFNKELPMDILEGMYRRITKPFKKDQTPLIKLRVPLIKQKVQSKTYDQLNNCIEFEHISKGSTIICILHVRGLKFLKKDYYCDNYISQIKLCETINYPVLNRCIIEDESGPDNEQTMYGYEILDEEVIQNNKEIMELDHKIKDLEIRIIDDQKELQSLREKVCNLK